MSWLNLELTPISSPILPYCEYNRVHLTQNIHELNGIQFVQFLNGFYYFQHLNKTIGNLPSFPDFGSSMKVWLKHRILSTGNHTKKNCLVRGNMLFWFEFYNFLNTKASINIKFLLILILFCIFLMSIYSDFEVKLT